MIDMDGWDIALLAVAAFIAVTALVRLMRARRDQLIADVRSQVEHEQRRRKAKKKKKSKRPPAEAA